MKKAKEPIFFNDIQVDSKEELYFFWYVSELLEHDYIKKVEYQPEPYILTQDFIIKVKKPLKTKLSFRDKKLVSGRKYTADFKLFWTEKAVSVLCQEIDISPLREDIFFYANRDPETRELFSVVDTKGLFDLNKSNTIFHMNQSDIWNKFMIYVQKVVPHYKRKVSIVTLV